MSGPEPVAPQELGLVEAAVARRQLRRRRLRRSALAALALAAVAAVGWWLLHPAPRALTTLRDHAAESYGLAYSHDGRWLATASRDRRVKIREALDGAPRVEFEHGYDNVILAFSPDDRFVILGGWHGSIRVHDVQDGRQVASLAGTNPTLALGLARDGKTLAAVRLNGRDEYEATTWNTSDWSERSRIRYPSWHQAYQLVIAPDGKTLAAVDQSEGQRVGLMDLTTGERFADIEPGGRYEYASVGTLAYSPDGRTLAIGRDRSAVEFWAIGAGSFRLTSTIALPPEQVVRLIAIREDNEAVAIGGFAYRAGSSGPLPIALSGPLASVGQNGPGVEHSIEVYRLPDRRRLARFDDTASVPRVAFSPRAGRVVITNRDNALTIWQLP